MSEPLVYIIVLNWNGWRDTLRCLESLRALDYPRRELLVVDNASSDDSVERLRTHGVDVLENPANLGFAAGNNPAIRVALSRGAGFVWLLNNDTTVEPGCLTRMVETALARPRLGAVGATILEMDSPAEVLLRGGGHVDLWLGRSRPCREPAEQPDFITGASLLVRREALEQVGLLDERFFMYFEDADFGLRLRQAGWELAVADGARLRHKGSGSLGRGHPTGYRYNTASLIRFFGRHAPVPLIPTAIALLLRLAKLLVTRRWDCVKAVLEGVRDASSARGPAPRPR